MKFKKPNTMLLGLTMLLIALAGVSSYFILNRGGDGVGLGSGDGMDPIVRELTRVSSNSLPDYAYNSKMTQAGYVVALRIPELLEGIPCYCSCGAVGHKSLKDCFLKGEEGFEEHASYCDICVNEALDVYTWQKEGVSLQEIRSRIDEKYTRFGEPTDTPPI
jgi:hypothetical protein